MFFTGKFLIQVNFLHFMSPLQRIMSSEIGDFGETHVCYAILEQLTKMVENGELQTVVDKVYHPQDIELALRHITSSESIGSTVITFR